MELNKNDLTFSFALFVALLRHFRTIVTIGITMPFFALTKNKYIILLQINPFSQTD